MRGNESELPGQIMGILNPCIDSLPSGRAMNMSGIAGEEDPSLTETRGLAP